MSELSNKVKQAEAEMDDVIKKRIYGNGATEMTEELRAKMIEILESCKDMAISTLREDGWPQVNTVGFVNMGEDVYFETFKTHQRQRISPGTTASPLPSGRIMKMWPMVPVSQSGDMPKR